MVINVVIHRTPCQNIPAKSKSRTEIALIPCESLRRNLFIEISGGFDNWVINEARTINKHKK